MTADMPEPRENATPSFARLADDALDLGRAALELFESELALSRQSLRRVAAGALVLPFLIVGFWLAVNGLLIATIRTLGCGWTGAFAIDAGVQFGILFVLVRALRRWLHDMSFPNSRQVAQQMRKWIS